MLVKPTKVGCTGCEACAAACPHGAIAMVADKEGFAYPQIDRERCTDCGLCRRICPVGKGETRTWQAAWAAFCKDEAVRDASSSGGVFSLLAHQVLGSGGVVFGVAMDQGGRVQHTCAESLAALGPLRGSKYVQSGALSQAYAQAKQALKTGRQVLFTGTPCQIAGLYAYLGKQTYEGLTTMDVVCHGVPSPLVWQAYLQALEAQKGSRVRAVSFRDKQRGWRDFTLCVDFADGTTTRAGQREDPYMVAFLDNMSLRPSCYSCPFAGEGRQADLTLADAWGAWDTQPELFDDKGLSLVLVGNEWGAKALSQIMPELNAKQVSVEEMLRYNPCIRGPVKAHERREAFLRHVAKRGFDGVGRFFVPLGRLEGFVGRVRRKVVKTLGGLWARQS